MSFIFYFVFINIVGVFKIVSIYYFYNLKVSFKKVFVLGWIYKDWRIGKENDS